jgi:hypothetical protein
VIVNAVVEGLLDDAVVRRLLTLARLEPGGIYAKGGKSAIREKLAAFNQAARITPWFVLVDLDTDADCAAGLKSNWLPSASPLMCFRVAVHEVESWLLADRRAMAGHLHVPEEKIPSDPDTIADAKGRLVSVVAQHSSDRTVRNAVVPRPGSGRETGPAYDALLIEFVQARWRPDRAATSSESLRRALRNLRRLGRPPS